MSPDARKWTLILSSILGTAILMNLILVVTALRHSPDPVPEAYDKALRWDAEQAQRRASQALGWQPTVRLEPSSDNAWHLLKLSVVDKEGTPIQLSSQTGAMVRPSDSKLRYELNFQQGPDGQPQARLPHLRSGFWDVNLELIRGSEVFTYTERIKAY